MRLSNNLEGEWPGLLLSFTSPEVAAFLEGHFQARNATSVLDTPIDEVRVLLLATYADSGDSRRLVLSMHTFCENKDTRMALITKFDVTLGLIAMADRPREYQAIQYFVNSFNNARFDELLTNRDFPDCMTCQNFNKDTFMRNPMYGPTQ